MAVLLEEYRAIFIDGQFPDIGALLPGILFSLACIAVGTVALMRYDRKFPYYLN